MKIRGAITMLINREYTEIQVEDRNASSTFITLRLTPEQLSAALSRQAFIECDVEVRNLDKVGKTMEHKEFEFILPKHLDSISHKDRSPIAEYCQSLLSDGWVADTGFASQGTFFSKDEQKWARTIIRRWI
jgi:hypothetical protein